MSTTDNLSNISQPETPYLKHPLKPGSIINLSVEYYLKDLILHLLPFIIIVSINFAINLFIIDKLINPELEVIRNISFNQSTQITQQEINAYASSEQLKIIELTDLLEKLPDLKKLLFFH